MALKMALKLVGLIKELSHFERIDDTDRLDKVAVGCPLAPGSVVMITLS